MIFYLCTEPKTTNRRKQTFVILRLASLLIMTLWGFVVLL